MRLGFEIKKNILGIEKKEKKIKHLIFIWFLWSNDVLNLHLFPWCTLVTSGLVGMFLTEKLILHGLLVSVLHNLIILYFIENQRILTFI